MSKLELDSTFIYKLILWIVVIGLVYLIYDLIFLFFIAYIIMSAVSPLAKRLEKTGLPRWLSAAGVFIAFFGLLVFFLVLSLPPLLQQTQNFLTALPSFIDRSVAELRIGEFVREEDIHQYIQNLLEGFSYELTTAPMNILRFGANIFGGLLDLIMVFIFSFYLIVERDTVHKVLARLIPAKDKKELARLIRQVEKKLGAWLRGQFTLMVLIGTLTYVGLLLIGMPYAFPLAVVAGFLEIIPILGPIIAAIPAILVGLAFSPIQALTVAFLYLLIQQLENAIVVPRIMKQAVGLDPLVVIVALMIGGRLAGPVGALLSVPTTAVLMILYQEKRLD